MTRETQLSERGHFCFTGLMACSLRGGREEAASHLTHRLSTLPPSL